MSKDKKSKKRAGGRQSSASYKSDLEKLFESGAKVPDRFKDVMEKLEPEEGSEDARRAEALSTLRQTEGLREFIKAFDDYRAGGFALPDEEELLTRMLDHPRESVIIEVLTHLLDVHRRRTLKGSASMKARLKTVKTTSDDPRIHAMADELADVI